MPKSITRAPGRTPGRSQGGAYADFAFAVATADDKSADLSAQARACFQKIEAVLLDLGSDASRILTAQVLLADIETKADFDTEWSAWVGSHPDHWPMRSCVGVQLAPGTLVEITVTAARTAG